MRNLKALGLALMAVFAMGAFVASAAQAQTKSFTATSYPAKLTGVEIGAANYFEVGGLKVECGNVLFDGTISEATKDVTITPTYHNEGGECETSIGTGATIDMNGCNYTFTTGNEVATHKFGGSVDIVCPVNKEIVVTAGLCDVDIAAQSGIPVTYTNLTVSPTTHEDVIVDIASETISAVVTNTFLCPIKTGAQSAKYISEVTVRGYKDPSSHTTADQVGVRID